MGTARKVMISLPEDLLARIDGAVAERGISRSSFLQDAARRELGWPDRSKADAAIARARAALAKTGSFESADVIREDRDRRDARDRRR